MKAFFDSLIQKFPVRNSNEQKEAFRNWVIKDAGECGLNASVSEDHGHKNIVIGNAETAKVIFTAHYDTPWQSPWPNLMLPKDKALFWIYQIGMLIPFLLVSSLTAFLVMRYVKLDYSQTVNRLIPLYAYLFTYYALFFLFIRGRKNRKNYNDNTSGVAAVLSVAKGLKPEARDKAAFILFDNEERGKKGSKAFARAHKEIYLHTPIINFDCVGLGSSFVVIEREAFKAKEVYDAFRRAYSGLNDVHFLSEKKAHANSDQTSFKLGIAVMACKKTKRGILYVDRIHTNKDTVVDAENLNSLKNCSLEFIESL